jgi:hypothetical protein
MDLASFLKYVIAIVVEGRDLCRLPFRAFILFSRGELESLRGEAVTKHRQAADRLRLCSLVLKHIPVLRKKTVFEPDNVGGDPGCGPSDSGEAPVRHNVITFGDDELILIAQCLRQ